MPTALDSVSPVSNKSGKSVLQPATDGSEATFDQALADSAEALETTDFFPLFTSLNLIEVDGTEFPHGGKPGGFLPLNGFFEGKDLPQLSGVELDQDIQSQLKAADFLKLDSSQTLKAEFLMDKFLAKSEVNGLNLTLGTTENLFSLGEGRDLNALGSLPTAALQTTQGAGTVRPMLLAPNIEVPVGQSGWDKAMGERIQWMVSRDVQNAEVKLTPPHLGPLEIRLSVQNDQANVTFLAAHATTREALEAAIPRLREMLGEANLNLANVDVGHRDSAQTGSDQAAESGGRKYSHREERGGGILETTVMSRSMSNGLVDDYA